MLHKLSHHWPVTSRREFFTRAGSGLAGIALASMLKADDPDPLHRSRPITRPRRSPSSGCSWKAAPATSTCSIPNPSSWNWRASPCRHRSAAPSRHGHVEQHANAEQADVQAVRPERHLGLGLVPQHRRTRGRHERHPLRVGRWVESCRLGLPDEHRLDPRRAAGHGRVDHVWAGVGQSQSAIVRHLA